VIISIDIIHAPGSITELSATDKPASSLFTYKFNNAMLDKDTSFRIAGIKDNDIVDVDSAENKRMTNLLYSVENLRKRVGDIDGAEAEAEQA
jgi:tRNA (guanine-N(7)-)-methyltransferase subunit TRM82